MSTTVLHISICVFVNIMLIIIGYTVIKRHMVVAGWLTLITIIPAICILFKHEVPALKMLAIITTTFICIKIIVTTANHQGKKLTLKFHQWLIFCIGWAGMRADLFENRSITALPNAWQMIRFGLSRIFFGILLILLVLKMQHFIINQTVWYILTSSLLLLSLSLILHFGILSICAGLWRLQGIDANYLFKQPLSSLSLTEFWGRRWNIAFIEMTTIAVYRPLKKRFGTSVALIISFLFSGILHELAISIPINSGFGLPTLYFTIQLIPLLIEKKPGKSIIYFLKYRPLARLWVLCWLVLPLPLLFNAEFVKQVIWAIINF